MKRKGGNERGREKIDPYIGLKVGGKEGRSVRA